MHARHDISDISTHGSGVVDEAEGVVRDGLVVEVLATSARLEVSVRGAGGVEFVEQRVVTDDARSQALLVQHRQDARARLNTTKRNVYKSKKWIIF